METAMSRAEQEEVGYLYQVDRLTTDPGVVALVREKHPEIINLPDGRLLLSFAHNAELPAKLPSGYGFAGGAARAVLQHLLGERAIAPRDLDVVGVSDYDPDPNLQAELTASLMPDDGAHGYGVKIESLASYFSTRDFYLNEVWATGDRLICTVDALTDVRDKIISPTAYEMERWYSADDSSQRGLQPKLVMKAVRLEAELIEQYGEGTLEGIADWQWNLREIPLFNIALALDKCQQLGNQAAITFCYLLLDRGVIDEDSVTDASGRIYPDQLALNLTIGIADRYPVTNFAFQKPGLQDRIDRYLAGGSFEDDIFEYYAELANRAAAVPKGDEY